MSPSPEAQLCEKCGTRIETTGSGEIGCLSCLLRAGLESGADGQNEEIPDSLGTYRIEHHEDGRPWTLGQGTMGVTYRTYDTSLRRPVALKLIKADFARQSPQARERFLREARAAASLRHPHVATIYQFGIDEDSGQYFCAMELVDGETLDEYVTRHGPLKVAAVLEIARQIASALVAAEKQRVVHRDLKPGNIMISTEEETGKISVKVIDFGLAKALDASDDTRVLTEGGFLGTPAFASPEQLRRDPVDVRSDVYSLGATLWYLLTGKMPFGDQAKVGPPIAQLKAVRAPRPLVALLVAMLAADPGARPSGLEIAGRLDLLSSPSRRRLLILASAGSILVAATLFYFRPTAHPPLPPVAMPLAKSIAVLPFENLGNGEQDAAFAEGMQEDLLTNLAHISELKVVSRASVLRYGDVQKRNLREIGRQLGVAFVIEGAIRREGQRVRTSAQLVDVRTNQVLWAQTYERSINDVFAIQSEISQSIAGQLGAKIAPREKNAIEAPPTRDFTVFALYTRANLLLPDTAFSSHGKAQLLRAAQLLGEAVARDPSFLLAWCQLAKANDSLYFLGYDRTPIRLSLAESAVNTALKLGPESGEAHLARARHLYQGYLAYEPALAEIAIARETLSNYPGLFTLTARIYRHQGKWQESAVEFENALSLDPRNVDIFKQIAISYNLQRRYADEGITLDRALAIAPEDVGLRITRTLVEFNQRANNDLPVDAVENYGLNGNFLIRADPWVVPEPSTAALGLVGGLMGAAVWRRKIARLLSRRHPTHNLATNLGGSIFVCSYGKAARRRVRRKPSTLPSRRSFASRKPQIHLKHPA